MSGSIDPAHYLVVTSEMQYDATVFRESDRRPFLGVSLTFPPELVAKGHGAALRRRRGRARSDARPITEAMRLMRMQAFRPLSVEAIARQVAMSPSPLPIGSA